MLSPIGCVHPRLSSKPVCHRLAMLALLQVVLLVLKMCAFLVALAAKWHLAKRVKQLQMSFHQC